MAPRRAAAASASTTHQRGDLEETQVQPNGQSFQTDSGYDSQDTGNHSPFDGDLAISGVVSEANKLMLETMSRLESVGMRREDLQLPRIVVVGDQSAGKSSLISAITGVPTPRNHITCTRAPLHINLLAASDPGSPWTCSITLVVTHNYFGNDNTNVPNLKYGGWLEKKDRSEVHFGDISNHAALDDMLKRAQAALLNPSRQPLEFRSCSFATLEKEPQVAFSPNEIRLDITAPNVPSLSLFDLPGIVNQTGRENENHFPGFVRKLARSYVEKDEHLIVLACTLETELDNSLSWELIRKSNAQHRCLGVLTKPDRLPKRYPSEKLRKILGGDEFRLGYGYYVTRQPGQDEINDNIGYENARNKENAFFQSHDWQEYQLQKFSGQFGTKRLNDRLSKLLDQAVRDRIPSLTEEIHEKIQDLDAELAEMPEPPDENPLTAVGTVLQDIRNELAKRMMGEIPFNGFTLKWKELCERYRDEMYSMRPVIIVRTPRPETISIDDSDDDADLVSPFANRKRGGTSQFLTPSPSTKRQKLTPRNYRTPRHELVRKFTLDEIRHIRRTQTTSAIPDPADPKADDYMIFESMKNWDVLQKKLLVDTITELRQVIDSEVLEPSLGRFLLTELPSEIKRTVEDFIKGIEDRHQEFVARLIEAELLKPMTLNNERFLEEVRKEKEAIEGPRTNMRCAEMIDQQTPRKPKDADQEQLQKDRDEKFKKMQKDQLPLDPYQGEIDAMARVRAYYNVAAARLVDVVSQAMRLDLLERCNKLLVPAIEGQLQFRSENGMANCRRLLEENPVQVQRREELKMERNKFDVARKELDELASKVEI